MMDNMKDKFAQFSGISIMLVSASMTLFTEYNGWASPSNTVK